MRVSRLEIFGFKSFVDRFVLNFDESVIGIVGPNGCGKSNIVDALRWVLGETHAKHLRGSVLEDLIFNGSDSRRPLGMAEVTITIRPQEGWASPALARISEMYETPTPPAEEAPDGEQSAAPAETEAASQASSLLDIPGLFDASEIQLTRRLYRSGESEFFINRTPCRLRDMTEFYNLIGLGARGLSIVQQGQIGDIVMRKPLERRELLEEAAGIGGFRLRIEAAQRKLDRTKDNLARLRDLIGEVEKQVRMLSRQAKRARERGAVKEELHNCEFDLFAARSAALMERREELATSEHAEVEALESRRSGLQVLIAKEEEARAELEQCDVELSDCRRERDNLMGRLAEKKARENELRLELTRIEGRIRAAQGSKVRVEERRHSIGAEIEKRLADLENLRDQEQATAGRKNAAEERLGAIGTNPYELVSSEDEAAKLREGEALEQEIQTLQADLERLPAVSSELEEAQRDVSKVRSELQSARDGVHTKQLRCASLESELRSLRSQLQALAEQVRRGMGLKDSQDAAPASGERVLLAGIKAPEHLQRPLAAVLGERATYLVSPEGRQLAHKYSESKEQNRASKKQFGVICAGSGVSVLPAETSGVQRLLDLITVDEDLRSVAEALLGKVYYVESLAGGFELSSTVPGSIAVTRDGEVVTDWGWYTTEGQGSAFAFTRLIEEREQELARAGEESAAALAAAEECEKRLEAGLNRSAERQGERDRLLGQQKQLSVKLQRLQEVEKLKRRLVLEEERKAQDELRQVSNELAAMSRTVSLEEKRVSELRTELCGLEKEEASIAEAQAGLELEQGRVQEEMEQFVSGGAGGKTSELEREAAVIEAHLKEIESRRNASRAKLAQEAHDLEVSRREVEKLQSSQSGKRLELEKCSLELQMLLEEMQRHHGEGIVLPDAAAIAAVKEKSAGSLGEFVERMQKQVSALHQRLEREGEVDPQSIEMHEQEKTRLDDMRVQVADLEGAAGTLERTIKHLQEVSRKRFIETFQDVSRRFGELVPRLFGGGAGHLELTNPDDPLGSGVEISVRPPGKKIRSMELLSGGEKALTAASILIAMFLHRPSPICVLDEVDAPLDDANVDRFLALIREIAATTQFLIITHNKASMSACDRLIGVTMQESGVTKALSVSFEEAAEEMDRLAAAQ